MGATSPHFSDAEMRCSCGCGANGCDPALLDALEAFRAAVGLPVIIESAYRCPDHNKAVGGSLASQHLLGLAADVRVKGMSAAEGEGASKREAEQSAARAMLERLGLNDR